MHSATKRIIAVVDRQDAYRAFRILTEIASSLGLATLERTRFGLAAFELATHSIKKTGGCTIEIKIFPNELCVIVEDYGDKVHEVKPDYVSSSMIFTGMPRLVDSFFIDNSNSATRITITKFHR